VTVKDNGVATVLACPVAGGTITCSDTTHSVTVAAGHFLTVQVTNKPVPTTSISRQLPLLSFRY
jgi:hypothetical protein